MARTDRNVHPEFIKYQRFIISHANYIGMPEAISGSGEIKWVTAGSSTLGKLRRDWWLQRKAQLIKQGIPIHAHAELSPVALAIHPTKEKACQTCGRYLKLEYVYPTKNCLKKINALSGASFEYDECNSIYEILDSLHSIGGMKEVFKLIPYFNELGSAKDIEEAMTIIDVAYVKKFSPKFSPGAMSNCPDRLDGYHSYNLCCRSKQDKGRHVDNLMRYGEDRRAYENWADGDWKAASWLMKLFAKNGVSADHIGPISLGFAHRPVFQPMSRSKNSSKGNRMTLADFARLLADEQKDADEIIVSWHSKQIWDRLKGHIKNEEDVLELCKLMRQNMHNVFTILSEIKNLGMDEFLKSLLHPEYAHYSIEFVDFDPQTGGYSQIKKTKGSIARYSSNAERYLRIAFEQLDLYKDKDNRKSKDLDQTYLDEISAKLDSSIKISFDQARAELLAALDDLAQKAEERFLSGKKLRNDLLDE